MARLILWSKEEFGERDKKLKVLLGKLKKAKENHDQLNSGREIRNLETQIQRHLMEEEVYWKQRSRADWLKAGDKNTKFFHAKASARRRKNKIEGDLFTTSNPSTDQINAALQGMAPKVDAAMNTHLEQPFTAEEIEAALDQMCPTKAPGPDRLQARHNLIHGLRFAKNVTISHFLFADDSLVFTKAAVEDCMHLKKVFDCYAMASGQIFNYEKSSIFFNDVKLKVLNKISNWQHKLFSSGGKEILIKAVAQAVPAYAMSVFKIPLGLCNDIQRAMLCQNQRGLGFRDVSCFNQALLAKQGWRLLQNPESLVAKVIKARYYKNTDFLNAKVGSSPSFIWRSILWGRQVLQKGTRWRIGNGEKIQIQASNWIPRPTTFKPIVEPSLPTGAKVSELILPNQQWNESMINQSFARMDADIIKSILLPRTSQEDEIIWHYDRKGLYSVKSGYQLALKIKFPEPPTSSVGASQEEDVFHALMECKLARKIWRCTNMEAAVQSIRRDDMLSTMHSLMKKGAKSEIDYVASIWWATWQARNKLLFEGKKPDPRETVAKAKAIVVAYQSMQFKEQDSPRSIKEKEAQRWNPPPSSKLKINVDAAVHAESQMAGLGAVIRNSQGQVVVAAIKSINFQGDVSIAEAKAVQWGMEVASKASFTNVIVETDCSMVADLANNKVSNKTEIWWTIAEIQSSRQDFQSIDFQHVPRQCNTSAHSLAKRALKSSGSVIWRDEFPADVCACLMASFK
ncbi:putative reverse transcriptase/RNA-dependent DNA polymerase [Citrus sinensis]|nr:putative reverse transcriptase/RNA-dependent DNA polymerase [Citrus sinensis]